MMLPNNGRKPGWLALLVVATAVASFLLSTIGVYLAPSATFYLIPTRAWELLIGAALALSGCIQVRAPEKPIEINLNVNVRQEVVVRLQQDAQDLIQNNPELFPQ